MQRFQLLHILLQYTKFYFTTILNLYMHTRLTGYSWLDHVQILVGSSHQRTPLHHAAASGHAATAQVLVENGADINVEDTDGVCECVRITHCVLALPIRGYDIHNCLANSQSLVSSITLEAQISLPENKAAEVPPGNEAKLTIIGVIGECISTMHR